MDVEVEEMIGPFTEEQVKEAAREARQFVLDDAEDKSLGCGLDGCGETLYVVKDGRVFIFTEIVVSGFFELTTDGLIDGDAPTFIGSYRGEGSEWSELN